MAFDPCREWLGIDALDLNDPRRVLGLPPHVRDADAIAQAAAARLQALRRISPGPFAKAHAALVTRVEESRARLLADAGAEAALPSPAPAPTGFRTPARPRRSSGGGLVIGSIVLLAAVAIGIGLRVARDGRQVAAGPLGAGQPAAADHPPAGGKSPVATPAAEASADEARGRQEREARAAEATRQREAEAEQRRLTAEAKQARAAADAESERLATEQRMAAAAEARAEQERRQVEDDRKRAEQERATMASAVDEALGDAYEAIQRQEFDTALRAITAAGKNVGDDVEAATRVERWRLFAAYAKEFPTYQQQAFAAANAGREFEADGVRFSIIEIKPHEFVYKLAGRIARVPREAVDPRIEMAVVAGWFAADGRAANHLFLGARWLSYDPPDVRRARREWQIAGDGGETVAPLMALLDDPVIRRAGR